MMLNRINFQSQIAVKFHIFLSFCNEIFHLCVSSTETANENKENGMTNRRLEVIDNHLDESKISCHFFPYVSSIIRFVSAEGCHKGEKEKGTEKNHVKSSPRI
jgi:hypothetical protein